MRVVNYLSLVLLAGIIGAGCCGKKEPVFSYNITLGTEGTVTPVPRNNEDWWMKRHEAVLKHVQQGNVDLLMIGDSITHGWEGDGKELWEKLYANRNPVNMGFSGDGTQHVLWRLQNGEIDGIKPRLAVMMIGTNNASKSTPDEIAHGIIAICQELRTKQPQMKILLLAIFPRGGNNNDPLRQVNEKTNAIICKLADNKRIYFLNINDKFLGTDSTLPRSIMGDLLHPNSKGYEIWANAQEPMISHLMK